MKRQCLGFVFGVITSSALIFSPTPAAADYMAEYRAYQEAFARGDVAGALKYGEAAWREAESALGDHPQTAIFAYNFATLALQVLPARAIAPFERALALTRQGIGSLDAVDVAVGLAEARLLVDPQSKDAERELKALLDDPAVADAPPTDPRMTALSTLAAARLRASDYPAAKRYADRAVAAADQLGVDDYTFVGTALWLGAQARLIPANRTVDDVREAIPMLNRAIEGFPPQPSIDDFDPLLGSLFVSRDSVSSLAREVEKAVVRTGSRMRVEEKYDSLAGADIAAAARETIAAHPMPPVRFANPPPAECREAVKWKTRRPPKFPPILEGASAYLPVGSVLIGLDLSETGVERAIALSRAPTAYTQPALESVKSWRLAGPPPEACRKNVHSFISFVVY